MNNDRFDGLIVTPNCAVDSYYQFNSFSLSKVNRAESAFHTAGGKGINMARAMILLGGVPFITGVLGGFSGKYIEKDLDKIGISHDFVWTNEEPRRCNTVFIQGQSDTTVMLESGRESEEIPEIVLREKILLNTYRSDTVILAGSLLPGFDEHFFEQITRDCKSHGLKVYIDTSGNVLRHAIQAAPSIIKINRSEFIEVFRDEKFSAKYAHKIFQQLSETGTELLIITNGSQGAYVFSDTEMPFQVRTPIGHAKIVSSAGSGDTFNAGLLMGLNSGQSIQSACTYASAAAAANLMELGCGFFDPEQVEKLLDKTEISELK